MSSAGWPRRPPRSRSRTWITRSQHYSPCSPGEHVAPVLLPERLDQLLDGLPRVFQYLQPGEHGPEPVLLPDVVTPRAEGLLPTETHPAGIHKVAEVFPAGRSLEDLDNFVCRLTEPTHLHSLGLRHEVDCSGGRHRPVMSHNFKEIHLFHYCSLFPLFPQTE